MCVRRAHFRRTLSTHQIQYVIRGERIIFCIDRFAIGFLCVCASVMVCNEPVFHFGLYRRLTSRQAYERSRATAHDTEQVRSSALEDPRRWLRRKRTCTTRA